MKLTWYGHSTFVAEFGNRKVVMDPFLDDNPSYDGTWQDVRAGVTHVLLTHGHHDHLGNALEICQETGAQLVANFEICMYLVGKGLPEKQINPGSNGGTVSCGGFTCTFVKAEHASSIKLDNGENIYLGNASGLVLHIEGEKTLYNMGDTDIFSDMALINELHQPQIAIVPVGDRFTMGGAVAALACQRYFKFETVIPCHYGTFAVIDPNADTFVAAMQGSDAKVEVMEVGGNITV